MATKSYRELSNAEVFDSIRSTELVNYTDRIPAAHQAGLAKSFQSLMRYSNATNQFIDGLINRIGLTVINKRMAFENPLRIFKSLELPLGDSVQELAVGLLREHAYDARHDGEDVFRRETPDVRAIYHKLNRQGYYHVTVSQPELEMAFLGEGQVQTFVDQLVAAPYTSAQVDEMLYMIQVLRLYHDTLGGYYYQKAGSREIADDGGRAKNLLKAIRSFGETVQFPSTRFNAAGMPVWVPKEDLVILTTPEVAAEIDVDALAGAFNVDRMNVSQQIITIPDELWPFDGIHTILTTKWFFQVYDKLNTTGEITNPKSLHWHSYYHIWQIISASIFAPAIAFTDELQTQTIKIKPADVDVASVAAIDVYPRNGGRIDAVSRGGDLAFDAKLTVPDEAESIGALIGWEVRGQSSPRTYITRLGVLHVGADETATEIEVRAYQIGSRALTNMKSVSIPVIGDVLELVHDRLDEIPPVIEGQPAGGFTRSATVGKSVGSSWAFTATGDDEKWTATGLPAGLTMNADTGVVSGTPTTAGSGVATLTATDPNGKGEAKVNWTVKPA